MAENGLDAPTDVHLPTQENEDDDDITEQRHFQRIVNAFLYYRTHAVKRLVLCDKHFQELPRHHRAMLSNFKEHLAQIRSRINHNYEIIKLIVENTEDMFENKDHSGNSLGVPITASDFDMDKVKTTLRQMVRDWSKDGWEERAQCYTPILVELRERFPPHMCKTAEVQVLVPGAGLGRLAFEIARAGYSCQGNEFSLFMLFASNFILNRCHQVNAMSLYPWIHQHSNNKTNADQLRGITFPDLDPTEIPAEVKFSMAAGDFLDVYTEPDQWDCIATVYFIDTGHNIIAYLETIYKILKPGGIWINLGPLLYHFADTPTESSVELSYEDVRTVMLKLNFEILRENLSVPSTYTQNTSSMLQYRYDCVFFVARKPVVASGRASRPANTLVTLVDAPTIIPLEAVIHTADTAVNTEEESR